MSEMFSYQTVTMAYLFSICDNVQLFSWCGEYFTVIKWYILVNTNSKNFSMIKNDSTLIHATLGMKQYNCGYVFCYLCSYINLSKCEVLVLDIIMCRRCLAHQIHTNILYKQSTANSHLVKNRAHIYAYSFMVYNVQV